MRPVILTLYVLFVLVMISMGFSFWMALGALFLVIIAGFLVMVMVVAARQA